MTFHAVWRDTEAEPVVDFYLDHPAAVDGYEVECALCGPRVHWHIWGGTVAEWQAWAASHREAHRVQLDPEKIVAGVLTPR